MTLIQFWHTAKSIVKNNMSSVLFILFITIYIGQFTVEYTPNAYRHINTIYNETSKQYVNITNVGVYYNSADMRVPVRIVGKNTTNHFDIKQYFFLIIVTIGYVWYSSKKKDMDEHTIDEAIEKTKEIIKDKLKNVESYHIFCHAFKPQTQIADNEPKTKFIGIVAKLKFKENISLYENIKTILFRYNPKTLDLIDRIDTDGDELSGTDVRCSECGKILDERIITFDYYQKIKTKMEAKPEKKQI